MNWQKRSAMTWTRSKRRPQLLGGRQETLGDAAFAFQALPRVRLLAVGWQGDEDFPPSYRVLFDGNSHHHLSTDACAILGSTLTRRLMRAIGAG